MANAWFRDLARRRSGLRWGAWARSRRPSRVGAGVGIGVRVCRRARIGVRQRTDAGARTFVRACGQYAYGTGSNGWERPRRGSRRAPSFDPKSTLDGAKPRLLSCYNQVRQTNTSLHGRLKLRINVNEAGTVLRVDAEEGGSANNPALTSCIGDAIKALRFPKPGGMATILVPLVFRPSPPSP